MTLPVVLLAAISLVGVRGESLRARAYFDANNVLVGDPMELTLDFIGAADFAALHPPALSRAVNRQEWKVDDLSAKTDTFGDARRLFYRLRPMREGVLWFPALEFTFEGPDGKLRTVRSNAIPVHAKGGRQVVVEGMKEDLARLPDPPPLVTAVTSTTLEGDAAWDWRRACAQPTADGFAAFDFPEARMNEAHAAIVEGNWARALKNYQRAEWTLGQTAELEAGFIAALARKYDNPAVELPVWRQVGRPVLRYGWKGRVGLVLGTLVMLGAVCFLLSRVIRALAVLALVLLPAATWAAGDPLDPFAALDRMHEQMMRQMQSMRFSFGGDEPAQKVEIFGWFSTEPRELRVGEDFNFVICLDVPKAVTLEDLRLAPSANVGLRFTGSVEKLADGTSANPSNRLLRLSVPARYDVPFEGKLSFSVGGMMSGVRLSGSKRGRIQIRFPNSFQMQTQSRALKVAPLDKAGQPADFSGLIASRVNFVEEADSLKVGTNDVIVLSYKLAHDGYLPDGYQPEGAAYEWSRQRTATGFETVEWKRYFVATGVQETPRVRLSYYSPTAKRYVTRSAGGSRITYGP